MQITKKIQTAFTNIHKKVPAIVEITNGPGSFVNCAKLVTYIEKKLETKLK